MATYGLLDVLLAFLAFFTTAWAFVASIGYWQAILGQVRESCSSGLIHPACRQLLWLVALTPLTWILAAALHIRNVVAHWNLMASLLGDKLAYTILDIFILSVILCGLGGILLTGLFFYHAWEEMKDTYMIIRLTRKNSHAITDLKDQRQLLRLTMPPAFSEGHRTFPEESSDLVATQAPGPSDTTYGRLANQAMHRHGSRPQKYDPVFRGSLFLFGDDPPPPTSRLTSRYILKVQEHTPATG